MIRVVMVEDHPIVQAGLARILAAAPHIALIETAARIEDLPSFAQHPDVVLLDLHLPSPLHGIAGVRHMADLGHEVLIVTGGDTSMEDVADAMAAGARGYLTKDADAAEYINAIAAVAAGRSYLGARLVAYASRQDRGLNHADPNRLTGREAEVAGLIVEGYTNGEIALILKVSERTVDGHVENIKQKLCESRRVRVAMKLREMGYEAPTRHRRNAE